MFMIYQPVTVIREQNDLDNIPNSDTRDQGLETNGLRIGEKYFSEVKPAFFYQNIKGRIPVSQNQLVSYN